MSQKKKVVLDADMLPEYDFSGAVRGKYYERYRQGSNVVVLDPDVSDAFPNAGRSQRSSSVTRYIGQEESSRGKA